MNVGLPYLEQIRAAGRKLADSIFASAPDDRAQQGVEPGQLATGVEDTGWGWVTLTFSQLVAAVTTGYHVEHNTDDTHKTVHASGAIYERSRTTAIGDWTDQAFAATNFTGSGAMTWAVTSTQQIAYAYLRLGTTIYLNYWFEGTTLGGTASSSFILRLPTGLRVAQYASAPFYTTNAGTATTGRVTATPGDSTIAFLKTDNTNWATGALAVQGQIAIKVDSSGDVGVTVVDPVLTFTGGTFNFASATAKAFTTAGTYTLTVNRAMTLTCRAAAGGGGGGGGGNTGGGGGGGGGATTTGTSVSFVTGKTYTLVIGAAGAGATVGAGTSGGATTLVNTTDAVTLVSLAPGTFGARNAIGTGGALVTGSNGVTGGDGNTDGGAAPGSAVNGAGGAGGGGFITTNPGVTGGNGSASGGTGGAANTAGGNNGGLAGTGGSSAAASGGGGGGGGGAQFTGSTSAFGGGGGGGGVTAAGNCAGGAGLAGGAVFTFVSTP